MDLFVIQFSFHGECWVRSCYPVHMADRHCQIRQHLIRHYEPEFIPGPVNVKSCPDFLSMHKPGCHSYTAIQDYYF